jgi:RNA methyltransferase, TrmH family
MLSRRNISFINSLKLKKNRQEYHCFVVEGSKLVEELLHSRLHIQTIYATPQWIETFNSQITAKKTESFPVTEKELERISSLKTANQVLALVDTPQPEFDPRLVANDTILMLDNINDPGNLGTIIRTADWFGIQHIICSPGTVDLFNPKTVQATMGSIARVNVYYLNLTETIKSFGHNKPVYGLLLQGKPLNRASIDKNSIMLLGSESHGISKHLLPLITHPLLIPSMLDGAPGIARPESLNAAVATAILCWEISR